MMSAFVLGAGYLIRNHYAPATITLEKALSPGPYEPITLHFSQSMDTESLSSKINFSKAIPITLNWQEKDTRLVLTPQTAWPIASSFTLSIGQGQTKYFTKNKPVAIAITTAEVPKISSISPAPSSRDVLLDIEDPIKVTFSQPVEGFYIDFRVDDVPAVVNQIASERTAFEVLPQNALSPGKEHTLDIYAKWKEENDETYTSLSHSTFTTLVPPPITPIANVSSRTEEAKKFTSAKKLTGKYIDINLASQVMTIFENGEALDTYMVSSGKRGMETPKGEFTIHNKADRPWSKKYGLYMPNWMSFVPSGLFGIHELPEWPGGYKEGVSHLGTPVSHGCVRLGTGPAKRVFEWAEIGTPVVIY